MVCTGIEDSGQSLDGATSRSHIPRKKNGIDFDNSLKTLSGNDMSADSGSIVVHIILY